jgi:DNA-binding beta-propeller fold protein YncE
LPLKVAALAKGVTITMLLSRLTIVAACIALAIGATVGLTRPADEAPAAQGQAGNAKPQAGKAQAGAVAAPVQPEAILLSGHKGAVNDVAFARVGKAIATAGADKTVRIWDSTTGTQLHKLDQTDKATGVAFSPDGKSLAAGSGGQAAGMVTLWDVDNGKRKWSIRSGGVGDAAVAFSGDGKRVMLAAGGTTSCVDIQTGRILFLFRTARGATTAVTVSPDGKQVAVANGGTILLMDPAIGRLLQQWRGRGDVTTLAFLASGAKVAAADGGKALRIIDVRNGREERGFEGKESIRAVAVSPDGKRIATAGAEGNILLWDGSGRQERSFTARGMVRALAFSADGKRLATAGADGVIIWDLMRDEKPLPKDLKLTEKELGTLWADLASDEGGKVYAATRLLRADLVRSVPFLQERLRSKVAGPDEKKIRQLIKDLDADDFNTRQSATKELEKLGRTAESLLRQALAGQPSLEVKRRVQQLLKPLDNPVLTAEQQRDVRAVRVLEQAGTAGARKLLEALSKESAGWWVTQEAKEAIARLTQREKKP